MAHSHSHLRIGRQRIMSGFLIACSGDIHSSQLLVLLACQSASWRAPSHPSSFACSLPHSERHSSIVPEQSAWYKFLSDEVASLFFQNWYNQDLGPLSPWHHSSSNFPCADQQSPRILVALRMLHPLTNFFVLLGFSRYPTLTW